MPQKPGEPLLERQVVLRWLYVGRLTLVTGILAAALLQWSVVLPQVMAVVMFVVAVALTAASFAHTHVRKVPPGGNFLYAQIVLDVMIVTGVIHVTQGPDSNLAFLYILVIASAALLLPLSGGVLMGGLASMLYFADLAWGYQESFSSAVALQIGLFTVVALVTGLLGDRLRRAGLALGAVESELRQLRLDTDDILANLSTGVITVDGEGRLAYANQAAESLLGLSLDRFLGQHVLTTIERAAPGMGALLEGGIRDRVAVRRFRTTTSVDGREVHLGVSTTLLGREDEQSAPATAIFQDITDLERLDELNRRTERLEAVAELSASLAHEIKNPLASIRSAVEQLGGDRVLQDDRVVLERLVLTESDRLSRLLSEFLEYSGLRLGTSEEIDLSELVRDCAALCRQHPEVEGVEIEAKEVEEPVRVKGDADLLHRALFNLLLNGAQAAGPGGRVTVSACNEPERSRPRGTNIDRPVRILVRDTGPGIPADVAARIFDPFFTTKESGSGLGLAVVHRAVDAHSGATFVDRAPGGGAQFAIFLPGAPRHQRGNGT